MIIAIGGPKGGSGKSTTTMNLAACFATHGYKVEIQDADPDQGSIKDWLRYRFDEAIKPEIQLVDGAWWEPGWAEIRLIDMQGADTPYFRKMIRGADAWLVPLKVGQWDMNQAARVKVMIAQLQKEKDILFDVFLNEVPTTNKVEERDAWNWLKGRGFDPLKTVIHNRKLYRTVIGTGKGVVEMDPSQTAHLEFIGLYYELMDRYNKLLESFKLSKTSLNTLKQEDIHGTAQ